MKRLKINNGTQAAIFLIFAVGLSVAILLYNNYKKSLEPQKRIGVNACSLTDPVKCYQLEASYERDCSGESCQIVFTTIFFKNGGSIKFRGCDNPKSSGDPYHCYPVDSSEDEWTIETL